MRLITLCLPLILILTSCGTTQDKAGSAENYEILQKLDGRFIEQKEVKVLRNRKEVFNLYAKFNQMMTPPMDHPEIDFSQNSVLAVPYQNKDKSTNEADLNSVRKTKDGIVLYFKESKNDAFPVNKNFWEKFFIVKIEGRPENVTIKTVQ